MSKHDSWKSFPAMTHSLKDVWCKKNQSLGDHFTVTVIVPVKLGHYYCVRLFSSVEAL